MKSLMSREAGGPENLEMVEQETPTPNATQVLINVKAAGVNFPDTLVIRDLYQYRPERPFAPGSEVAGIVEVLGDGVTNLHVGQRVQALVPHGAFSTHLLAHVKTVSPIPDAMPFDEAAGFIFTYGTTYYALKDRGHLQAGQSMLVLGAAGGIGSSAIEIGKAMGAKVIAAVSSEEKAEFCRSISADATIVYPRDPNRDEQKAFSDQVKALTDGKGVDVVYDVVGGAYAEPALRAIAWEGHYLVVGFPAGIPKLPLNLVLLKSCQVAGVFWGAFTQRNPKRHQEFLTELFDLYEAGKLKPQVTSRYSLEDGAKALVEIESRQAMGKIIIEP
ncbi:NADPH:quinone oxidoreductase family protein [Alphaproteobacteria bacterium]|nr:NADPH:quinone oxidoreductase family protein [Alphaproteobacteria bacterium]